MHMQVLVAEDDALTREGLCTVLRDEGFGALPAADGLHAWDVFCQHAPDFVCLDVMLPGMSGYDLCRKIRGANPRVPVVFITAKGEEIDKVVGLEIGGDDYIVKPFGLKEVVARIRAVARRCLSQADDELQPELPTSHFCMGGLMVYPMQLRARRGDQQFDLSLREIKILVLLFRAAGQVVDRHTLMNYAWNQDYLPNSRTLDQHISQLRKRIEIDPKHPQIIQTVHGAGYRYEALPG